MRYRLHDALRVVLRATLHEPTGRAVIPLEGSIERRPVQTFSIDIGKEIGGCDRRPLHFDRQCDGAQIRRENDRHRFIDLSDNGLPRLGRLGLSLPLRL